MENLTKAFSSLNASSREESQLAKYFVVTRAIEKVANPSSKESVLVGLKGIGKTAAFRYFSEFGSSSDILISLAPSTYAIHLQKVSYSPEACSHQFEYEIAVELLSKFVSEKKNLGGKVSHALFREAEKHKDTFVGKLTKFGGRVTGVSILGCGLQLSDPKVSILTGLKGRKDELAAISTLCKVCDAGVTMKLVIDDPEEIFSAAESIDENLIGGLIIAGARLNELSNNLKIIILIKSHVFETISESVGDLDKYPGRDTRLWWSPQELQQAISRRVAHFCKLKKVPWYKTVFGNEFEEAELDKLFEYILPNIRNGPRDLILWFQLALDSAEKEGRKCITYDDFQAVFPDMSRKSLRTLGAIYKKKYDGLPKFIKSLFGGATDKEFTPAQLVKHIQNLMLNNLDYQRLMSLPWLGSTPSYDQPEILFRCGLLGYKWKNKKILPYMDSYELEKFQNAESYFLIPALVPSVQTVGHGAPTSPSAKKGSKKTSK